MAVMASHAPETAVLDQKPIKVASALETDAPNGSLEVNGHNSHLDTHPAPDSEILSATDKTPETDNPSKTPLALNQEAFGNNQALSANPKENHQTPEPEVSRSSVEKKTPEDNAMADVEMGDAPAASPAADVAKETPASPPVEKSVQEPVVSTEPEESSVPASEPQESAPLKADSPPADAETKNSPATAAAPTETEQFDATQDTNLSNATTATPPEDLSLRPSNVPSLSIDAARASPAAGESIDVSMADVPPSPLKVSREREGDEEVEPAAKRAKTGAQGDSVEVKTLPSAKPEAEQPDPNQASLYNKDGEPKNMADKSLDGNSITPWQARKIRSILAGIKKTKAGANFKGPVETLWPALWLEYQAKVPEPTDIGTMEKRLKGGDPNYTTYQTLGEFKADLQRLYDNSIKFNGEGHDVTKRAETVRDQVLDKMAAEPAVEVVKVDKKETVKHHPSRQTAPRVPPPRQPQPVQKPPKPVATSPVEKPAESPAFAIPPNNNGVPLIRRDSTKNADDRPKRPIHPPKNKDLGYEPKKKKKLAPDQRFCDEVLTELKKAKYYDLNQDFLAPVDPIALNIPNYHKIVKKPMDMQTMTEKLHTAQYTNPKDFEKDFGQIVKNCRTFNGDDHFVTQKAIELEKVFKREWAKKDDWMAKHAPASVTAATSQASAASPHAGAETEEEEAESEVEVEDEKEQSSATLDALQSRLDEENDKLKAYMKSKTPDIGMVEVSQSLVVTLQRQIIQERMKLSAQTTSSKKAKPKPVKGKKAGGGTKKAAGSGAAAGAGNAGGGGGGGAGKKAGGAGKKSKRTIGTLEKEVIAHAVPNLDGDPLNRAIDIIKRDTNENENDSGELELDLEVLSVDALLKLYDISIKAFPTLKAEKERNLAAPPAPQDSTPAKSKSSGKPKKNKPMSKAEQERRLQQLNDLKASIKNRGSGSQEPIESIEGNGSALSPHDVLQADDSDEESSEEE